MQSMTIDVDITQIVNLLDLEKKELINVGREYVKTGGDIFINRVKEKLLSGTLKDSIGNTTKDGIYNYKETSTEIVLEVGTKRQEMIWLELGVKPHMIYPKNRKALMWGDGIFSKSVKHPGFGGKFIMTRSAEETRQELIRMIKV